MRQITKYFSLLIVFSLIGIGCDAPVGTDHDSAEDEVSPTKTVQNSLMGGSATTNGNASSGPQAHEKATGGVTWSARGGNLPGLRSTFEVHENAPGKSSSYGDRGRHRISRPADASFPGGSLTLDVKCVNVEGDEAWFAGVVTMARGGYSSTVGDVFLYWVKDYGSPGTAGPDKIGGISRSSLSDACTEVKSGSGFRGSGFVTGGNLTVHSH